MVWVPRLSVPNAQSPDSVRRAIEALNAAVLQITEIVGSGYITDAPVDGTKYGRKDGVWSVIGGGTGDVIGPATNPDEYIPLWNGVNSKILKAGIAQSTFAVAGHSHTEDSLSLGDVVTANATTSQHGFLKKLSNNSAEFMNGLGNWTTPPGGISDAIAMAIALG